MASPFSGKAGRLAANYAQQTVGDAYNQSKADLQSGYDQQTGYLNQARDLYKPIGDDYAGYAGMYKNGIGLGGAQGSADALAAFRGANPGYGFMFDQGQQALARQAAAGGRAASGNALLASQRYGQGLADQTYQGWLQNLGRGGDMAFRGIQGQSQALDALGRGAYQYGSDKATMGQAYGDKAAGIGMGGLMAGQTAAQNKFNFAGQLGNTFANLLGQAMGGGGKASTSIFSGVGG